MRGEHHHGLSHGSVSTQAGETDPPPVPEAVCGPGSHPEEDRQGRVPASDWDSGRALEGYWCNAKLVARVGPDEQGGTGLGG